MKTSFSRRGFLDLTGALLLTGGTAWICTNPRTSPFMTDMERKTELFKGLSAKEQDQLLDGLYDAIIRQTSLGQFQSALLSHPKVSGEMETIKTIPRKADSLSWIPGYSPTARRLGHYDPKTDTTAIEEPHVFYTIEQLGNGNSPKLIALVHEETHWITDQHVPEGADRKTPILAATGEAIDETVARVQMHLFDYRSLGPTSLASAIAKDVQPRLYHQYAGLSEKFFADTAIRVFKLYGLHSLNPAFRNNPVAVHFEVAAMVGRGMFSWDPSTQTFPVVDSETEQLREKMGAKVSDVMASTNAWAQNLIKQRAADQTVVQQLYQQMLDQL